MDPKLPRGFPIRSEEQPNKRARRYQLLLFVGGIALLGFVVFWILDWYMGPTTVPQKGAVYRVAVVLVGAATFLFALSFIARYLQIPHFGIVGVTFFVVVVVLWILVQPETAQDRTRFFQTVGAIVGGSALLFGLYFTAQTLRINREGQITERFTRAIDQLGATYDDGTPRIEIRLGGIYALERIAGDSPERDYSTVMEVLTAYVRENTRQAPGPSKRSSEESSSPLHPLRRWFRSTANANEVAEQAAPLEPRRPTADIQAILDVLRRAQNRVPKEYRTSLDLHEAFLRGAALFGANLRGANLYNANLQKAILQEADLQEAILLGAKVTDAQLADTLSLQGATMPDGSEHP
jgi:hypothetical protein